MQRCEKCQRLISDQATVCPHCGARYDVAAMPDPQKDIKRKRMKIALFILSGVAVILIAAIVVLLILRSIPKARTFDFSCTEYTDKINALLGTDKLDKDKWNITEAEAVYTADSFYIRLDTDKDSQRATKITVGPADSEDAVKMAAASLMVVYTEYTQTIAIDEIGRYRDGDRYIILPPDPVPATEATTKPTLPTLPTPESATATEVITEEVTEPPSTEPPKTTYTAMELVGKNLSEIIELTGDDFYLDKKDMLTAFGSDPVWMIYNDNTMPGIGIYLEYSSETYHDLENGVDIREKIKSGYYEIHGFVVYGTGKVNDLISADMTYNQIAAQVGEHDCRGVAQGTLVFGTEIEGYTVSFYFFGSSYYGFDGRIVNNTATSEVMNEVNPKLRSIAVYPKK